MNTEGYIYVSFNEISNAKIRQCQVCSFMDMEIYIYWSHQKRPQFLSDLSKQKQKNVMSVTEHETEVPSTHVAANNCLQFQNQRSPLLTSAGTYKTQSNTHTEPVSQSPPASVLLLKPPQLHSQFIWNSVSSLQDARVSTRNIVFILLLKMPQWT